LAQTKASAAVKVEPTFTSTTPGCSSSVALYQSLKIFSPAQEGVVEKPLNINLVNPLQP
jgi:hypothetical protein